MQVLEASRRISSKEIPAEIVARRPGDPAALYATSDYARQTIAWSPKYSDLDTIISSTWEVYKKAFE